MTKLNLNENFICRIWENKSYYSELKTISGEKVEVIDYGNKNYDAGPDYKNAKVKIGEVTYSGSIEIHRSLNDWHQHNHKRDDKYNDLVLHVVFYENDVEQVIENPIVKKSRAIPTIILSEFITESIHTIWKQIISNPSQSFKLPCYPDNKDVAHTLKVEWLTELSKERLKIKSKRMKLRLEEIAEESGKKIYWEQVLFEFVCEALGYSKNKEQFNTLAKRIDLIEIKKLNLDKLEFDSLLFGLSGFLNDLRFRDTYAGEIKSGWNKTKDKLRKEIMNKSEWNFFRLRPPNFPTLRIAYASGLLFEIIYKDFFKAVIKIFEDSEKVKRDLEKQFQSVRTSDYWRNHYNFGRESKSENNVIGIERITDIITNVIVPFVYLYSIKFEKENLRTRIEFFYKKEKQKRGSNEVTKVMEKQLDVNVNSLADEQGLIQLHNYFCVQGKCSECEIGKIVFADRVVSEPMKIILY